VTISSIAAVSPDWVIGRNNDVPWRHPGDFRRFKRVTLGGTVIMGRLTWESMNKKPLPGRRNIVVTRTQGSPVSESEVLYVASVERALDAASREVAVWFVGGARIYEEAMAYVDEIDITYVPDVIPVEGSVRFPRIDPEVFDAGPLLPHEDEEGLTRRIYRRRHSAKRSTDVSPL
jgi:dihydrofolate reductase